MTTYLPSEIDVLRKVSHPNIIKVFDIAETDCHCFLSLELAENGSLLDYINLKPAMPEQEARFLFNQLCQAVHYCHSKDIVHRDIKCDNILLDKYMNLKLGGTPFSSQSIEYTQYNRVLIFSRFWLRCRLKFGFLCWTVRFLLLCGSGTFV